MYEFGRALRGVETVLSDPAHGEYLVAEADGCHRDQLTLILHWHDLFDANVATIEHVFVHPMYRGNADSENRKVYDALHQHAIERCRQQNVPQLNLHVVSDNLRVQRAYEKRGLTATGLWMTKRLN
ncbi:GNAT family N-acetyltransferase [Rubinisphaera margarita]|uniref:GNAT family N-acetyltransferase n=1 Tax=Rubinisphaera margarita TaxID=2909586 RepID=UPI001EE7F92A|nr:GNAT family N-acetyltransferase [Rubinisphaera margarita]MCG6157728.1 GNAT family N-acetyltransferase [Rubinisphaera margarita]